MSLLHFKPRFLPVVLCCLLLIRGDVQAQISGPATVVAGTPVAFSSATTGTTYTWVFDTVDISYNAARFTPSNATLLSGNNWGSGYGSDMLNDNGSWYSFVPNPATTTIIRLSYGSDPTSTPVKSSINVAALGIPAGSDEWGMNVIKNQDDNKWYGIMTDAKRHLLVLDFGSSPANAPTGKVWTFTATELPGTIGADVAIRKYNGQWLVFACYFPTAWSGNASRIVRYDFPSGLSAAPTATPLTYSSDSRWSSIGAVALYQQGGSWYMMGMNTLGYNMVRLSFGADLRNNSPQVLDLGGFSNAFNWNARAVSVVTDCNQLVAYAHRGGNGAGNASIYDFNGSITNTPVKVFQQANGAANGSMSLRPYVWKDTLNYLINNNENGMLYRLKAYKFPAGTVHKYYDPSVTHTFNTPGVYNVTLYVDQGMNTGPAAFCTTVTVTVPPAQPGPFILAGKDVCEGETNVMYVVPSVPLAAAYEWSYSGTGATFAPTTTDTVNTLSFSASATGGTLSVRAVNISGHSTWRDTAVAVHPTPRLPAITGATAVCENAVTMLANGTPGGVWSSSATDTATVSSTGAVTGVRAGIATISYIVRTGDGCADTAGAAVTVHGNPVVTLSPPGAHLVCEDDSLLLTAAPLNLSYAWLKDAAPAGSGSAVYYARAGGHYRVVATDANNCSDSSDAVTVTVQQRPYVFIHPDNTAICAGTSTVLHALPQDTGLVYDWTKGASPLSAAVYDFLEVRTDDIYTVRAAYTRLPGCADTAAPVQVTISPLPVAEVTWDGTLLHATPGFASYQWSVGGQEIAGAQDSSFAPAQRGAYTVSVTDSNGCAGTSVYIQINNAGVADMAALAASVRIYPNPVADRLYVHAPQPVRISLSGADGRLLLGETDAAAITAIDMRPYTAGLYLLRITDEHGAVIRNERIVKGMR